MKSILVLLVSFCLSVAIEHTTTTYTPVNGALISSAGNKANFDSLRNGVNQCKDTFAVFTRWKEFSNGDSTFKKMHIDTIIGVDTINVKALKAQRITAVDTSYMRSAKVDSADIVGPITSNNQLRLKRTGTSAFYQFYVNSLLGVSLYDYLKSRYMLNIDSARTFSFYNGGHIKNDVYDTGMVAATNMLTNYIQFGTTASSRCSVYVDTTFPDSLYDGTTFRTAGTGHIVQIGSSVRYHHDPMVGTITSTTQTYIRGIPTKFLPSTSTNIPITIQENTNSYSVGMLTVGTSGVFLAKGSYTGASFYLEAGNGGMLSNDASWIK
jgi:hypothetical protein